ncbi:MAG: glucose-1-phosphate thymidylyltransferase [Candidatus Eiseniibacteriota bacterium]
MKGLILSGGKGTRLRPITHTSAKQLVPVANKPILFYGLESIVAAGIPDIGIVVGDTHAEIREAVGDGSRFGARVEYIRQSAPLGLAHAVKESRDFLRDDPFVMYLGDNFLRDGIQSFVKEFEEHRPDAQILLVPVPNPQDFGVAELEGDRVKRLEEKPKAPRSNLALVGVYMFTKSIWPAVEAIRPSGRNELEITDAIQWLVDHGKTVRSHVISGWWKDTGKLEDMLEANRMAMSHWETRIEGTVDDASVVEGAVVVGKNARVVRSRLRGPLILGPNVLVEDAYVGPFSAIADGAVVRRAEIEHSIVLERSVIEDVPTRIDSSLIGRDVVVTRSPDRPRAHHIMVGDSSRVELA